MNRKFLLTLLLFTASMALVDCSFPGVRIAETTQTPTPVTPAQTPTSSAPSKAELGLAENPIILALPPSADSQDQIEAAGDIAAEFMERTGYVVVTVVPDSYAALVEALGKGNAHIVMLDPYAYELAFQNGWVRAAFAVVKDGRGKYGAQFIAARRGGFKSHVNPQTEQNTADAGTALAQFSDKKPCWSDETSPSGYVIPLGFLKKHQIITSAPAFVEGHPTVVRSLYASGICDFGATYIDARKFPSLEDEFPDLMEQVILIWRIPDIIPYDVVAFSTSMPQPIRDLFAKLIPAILQTDARRAAFKTAFDIEELQAVNDAFYDDFRTYVDASGIDLSTLVK